MKARVVEDADEVTYVLVIMHSYRHIAGMAAIPSPPLGKGA